MLLNIHYTTPSGGVDRDLFVTTYPLHQAILEGDEESIKAYLVGGRIDPNVKDQNGQTPLSLVVDLFCKPNLNVNKVSDDKLRNIAMQMLELETVDANIKDRDGNTPLSMLLKDKRFEFARLFLSFPKTDPNVIKANRHTELTRALYYDDLDIVEFLLSFPQTDPNARNMNNELPLDLALRCGGKSRKLDKVKWFLAHPRTVVATQLEDGNTPLSVAIKLLYTDIVKLLIPHDKEGASVALANHEQLVQFQKKNPCILFEEDKLKIRIAHKNHLDFLYSSAEDVNENFVTYHAVADMAEVASILSQSPLKLDTMLGFIDVDETLVFSGSLGWLNECFNRENMLENDRSNVSRLLQKYGFKTAEEFAHWGNDKFGLYAGTWDREGPSAYYISTSRANFCSQSRVIDSNVATIFKDWFEQGIDLYSLTARGFDGGNYTKEQLGEEKIDFTKLARIQIEKPEQNMSSGIIYSEPKFGKNAGGIKFLQLYLEKLAAKSQLFPNVEIIVVDNCPDIFAQIISLPNRQEIQRLEQKFNTKISFKYFQPFEELWRSPHNNWGKIKTLVDEHNPKEIAYQVLQNFLETFCSPVEDVSIGSS